MDSLCDLKRGEFNGELAINLGTFRGYHAPAYIPNDRVLVIYGQGHAKLLRSFIKDSRDLQFVDSLTVLNSSGSRGLT